MLPPEARTRLALVVIGLFVLVGPVVILATTLGALVFFGVLALDELTLLEVLELYLAELILFLAFGYGVYRVTVWLVDTKIPESLDALAAAEEDSEAGGESGQTDR